MTLLVTGTGGGAGQSILKSLQKTDYRVIAADGEVLGTGLYTTGCGYVVPYACSPEFVPRLLDLCVKEQVKVLFPGLDAELPVLSRHREAFAKIGVTVVVSDERVIQVSDDKLLTAEFLKQHGLPYPQTWTLADCPEATAPYPLIIKPKVGGARSNGVRVVRSATDLAQVRAILDGAAYVAQEMIEGPEYTCGSLTLGARCHGAITLRRILRDGDTYKAFVERQPTLESFVVRVADLLQAFGPCNFQLRLREGVPYLFEFNARCSGTTYCRTLAGFNEPKMISDYLLRGVEPQFEIRPLTVLRYWNELVVENEDIQACGATGQVIRRAGPLGT
jgi:carbamoyl-phosphate synthase large subunit